jgi:hypothetical protein
MHGSYDTLRLAFAFIGFRQPLQTALPWLFI